MSKELREWIILASVAGFLYFTGLHTPVIGFLQRVVLATGIITPDIHESSTTQANYSINLEDLEGRPVSFQAFKQKVVFLNFWATWCAPCIAEMPDIHALYEATGKEVEFIIVSVDDDKQKAKAFIEKKGYRFPVYFLRSSLPAPFSASTIPSSYVISPQGNVVVSRQGMAKYNTADFRTFLLAL